MPTREDYVKVFEAERANRYTSVDAFEERAGYAIERGRLEDAAFWLACPVKKNPPNWQHGRVIYAEARRCVARRSSAYMLDLGTAKGFSALMMAFALRDSGNAGCVVSVDVVDPDARVARNSVAELGGLLTVREFLTPWDGIGAELIGLVQRGASDPDVGRIDFAMIDGRHAFEAVLEDGSYVASHQRAGDIVFFDDLQIDGVRRAVEQLREFYEIEVLQAKPERIYGIGVHR